MYWAHGGLLYSPSLVGNMKQKITESTIQRDILNYLESRGYFAWRHNNIPTYGRNKFVRKGAPDIFCLYRGKLLGIEVKLKSNTHGVSKEQQEWGDELERNGGIYIVAYDFEDVVDVLKSDIVL